MKTLRQIHLYLGCVFAPLIVYFCLSGTWQVFGFNDVPRDSPATWPRSMFHEISKPHTHATLPGSSPKTERSVLFSWLAAAMALGMITTALLGITLAFRTTKSPKTVALCLLAGAAVPVVVLFLR